jgi:hypothetical protein
LNTISWSSMALPMGPHWPQQQPQQRLPLGAAVAAVDAPPELALPDAVSVLAAGAGGLEVPPHHEQQQAQQRAGAGVVEMGGFD